MSRGLADTSVFIAREGGRTVDAEAFPDGVTLSIITIGDVAQGARGDADDDFPDVEGLSVIRA